MTVPFNFLNFFLLLNSLSLLDGIRPSKYWEKIMYLALFAV